MSVTVLVVDNVAITDYQVSDMVLLVDNVDTVDYQLS